MKSSLELSGKTTDGKLVAKNVFRLIGTYGIAMDSLFEILDQNNIIPDWSQFYIDAKKDGWKDKTILTRLEISLIDVHGKDFSDHVLEKLRKYLIENKEDLRNKLGA